MKQPKGQGNTAPSNHPSWIQPQTSWARSPHRWIGDRWVKMRSRVKYSSSSRRRGFRVRALVAVGVGPSLI
eukprot:200040-Pelagomonas_calceolata.AAC.1